MIALNNLYLCERIDITKNLGEWKEGRMDGRKDGRMEGWKEGKAGLRIAYSYQQISY